MTTRDPIFDTHGDLLIQRYKQGVRLIEPGSNDESANNSVSSIYGLAVTAYFLDCESRIVNSNEATAELVGAISISDMLGKTVEAFAHRATVAKVLATDKKIFRTEVMSVTEETAILPDNFSLQALSFKFPWYYDNTVIGIFGCSIKTGGLALCDFANIVSELMATGLLGSAQSVPMRLSTQYQYRAANLSEREQEVLSHVIRGKTAKEIGNRLGISRRTVEHHIEAIKLKTNSVFKSDLIDKFV
jgi:DNA-binding CsgD family transcriptional regulator